MRAHFSGARGRDCRAASALPGGAPWHFDGRRLRNRMRLCECGKVGGVLVRGVEDDRWFLEGSLQFLRDVWVVKSDGNVKSRILNRRF